MFPIRFFSAEQEASIAEFQEKWQSISISTDPIDCGQASAAVQQLYAVMGKTAPEIIFCDSPRSVLEQLETNVSQVEIPKIASKSSEDIFQGWNFAKLFSSNIWQIFRYKNKQKKAKTKIISDLIGQVSRQPSKSLTRHIDSLLPKDLTTKQIVEQSFLGASPLFKVLGRQQARQGEPNFLDKFEAKPSKGWQESFSETASAIEQQLFWLPGKKIFFRLWLKGFIKTTLVSKITGVENPKFQETFSSSVSYPQFMFMIENPPCITPNYAIACIWLDFAFSVLEYPCKTKHWKALQDLVQNCGWIFIINKTCYICDRPAKILLDEDRQLHGEGESALAYSDGYKAYAYHGIPLPEKYGAIHPAQWQPAWVLEEDNQQLRRVLMQGMGLVRLCQELPLIKLEESWEYTLFKLDEKTGAQATHILRRINKDTSEIKALLVSWTTTSLSKAIQYAHKNHSKEDFPLPDWLSKYL